MQITLVDVEDYKKIRKITIVPGKKHLILIAGMNEVGKTSLLSAMTNALGGKGEDPKMPIRKGADHADIKIELDNGEYTIHKRFLKSGNSSLKVEGKDGKLASPQKLLDRIKGTRFLDPLKFSRLGEMEQRAALLQCVDLGLDLDKHDKERKTVFDKRTEANRDAKRAKAQLDDNPDPGEIPEVSTVALVHAIGELNDKAAAHASTKGAYAQLKKEAEEKKEYIARLKKNLEKATKEYEQICDNGREAKENLAKAPDVYDELAAKRRELETASGQEEDRIRKMAQLERHKIAKLTFKDYSEEAKQHTEKLEALDKKKKTALDNAEMPVPGMSIDDDGLTYNNIPLSQASGAQQLMVSLALASKMSPELRDIWVEDGSLLDKNSLKLVEEFAIKNKVRFWLERVGEGDENALILEDGSIRV